MMVLLAAMRVGDEAYGITIAQELTDAGGREVLLGSVYAALQRLESKGLIKSTVGEPTAERGGRAKKYFKVTAKGVRDARQTQRAMLRLWMGLREFESRLS